LKKVWHHIYGEQWQNKAPNATTYYHYLFFMVHFVSLYFKNVSIFIDRHPEVQGKLVGFISLVKCEKQKFQVFDILHIHAFKFHIMLLGAFEIYWLHMYNSSKSTNFWHKDQWWMLCNWLLVFITHELFFESRLNMCASHNWHHVV